MAEKVSTCGVQKEKGYLYYLGKDGNVWASKMARGNEKGGYAKTLKRIYINWATKRKYKYITGHVKQGVSKNFSKNTQIVKTFSQWYGQKTPFEYYRRPLK